MSALILVPFDAAPTWPYSLAQLRADNPNVSFSANPTADDLAPFDVFGVEPTDPPEHDPTTHRAQEVTPVDVDGVWQQSWELIELPPAPPVADWGTFKAGLLDSEAVSQVMTAARAAGCEPAASALPVALEKAQSGNSSEFAACWGRVVVAGEATTEALAALVAAAQACNLPADFVAALQPERERARNEQGRFIADDPATPQNEAWMSSD